MSEPCHIEGCERPVRGWGLCKAHWQRWRKYGDPLGSGKPGLGEIEIVAMRRVAS